MAGPVLGKAYIEIQPDLKGFGTQLTKGVSADAAKAANGYNQSVGTMTQANSRFGQSLQTMRGYAGVAALGIGAGLVGLAKNATDLAVAAEDAASKFSAVFGPSAGKASAFVEDFANKAGFATYEMENMLATTANVAGGLGATGEQALQLSTDLATMAGDVASFNGATSETPAVLHAMQSALTGEREALKTYGIVITEADVQTAALAETGKQSAEDLTTLDKALASVNIIAERAGAAMGDLDKTADSASNQTAKLSAEWKDAQVSLGQGLIPVMVVAVGILGDFTEAALGTGDAVDNLDNDLSRGANRLKDYLGIASDGEQNFTAAADAVDAYTKATADGTGHTAALAEALAIIADNAAGPEGAQAALGAFSEATGVSMLRIEDAADAIFKYVDVLDVTAEELETLEGWTSAAQAATEAQIATFESEDPVRYASIIAEAAAQQRALAGETTLSTEALLAQADAERALIDPVFALHEAHRAWMETRRQINKDGKVTVQESLDITAAYSDMEGALAAVDDEHKVAFSKENRDALLAAGVPIEDVNALLGETSGRLDAINTGNFQVPLDDQQLRDAYESAGGLLQVLREIDGDTITTTYRLNASVDTLERALGNMPSGQHGGHIATTGPYLLHSGETVLTDAQQRNIYDVVTSAAALAERSAGGAGPAGVTVANTFLGPVGGSMASFAAEIARQSEIETRFARA